MMLRENFAENQLSILLGLSSDKYQDGSESFLQTIMKCRSIKFSYGIWDWRMYSNPLEKPLNFATLWYEIETVMEGKSCVYLIHY